jgi:hypothetical protein
MTGGTPAAEPVTGRTIPRYRGPAIRHTLRFFRTEIPDPGHRYGGIRAKCDAKGCLDTIIDGGVTAQALTRFNRQHSTGKP